jgi:hypothetical protein
LLGYGFTVSVGVGIHAAAGVGTRGWTARADVISSATSEHHTGQDAEREEATSHFVKQIHSSGTLLKNMALNFVDVAQYQTLLTVEKKSTTPMPILSCMMYLYA